MLQVSKQSNSNHKNKNHFQKISFICLIVLVQCISTINSVNIDTHRLTKRMDLELCLGQFDVHHNTIIRTEESLEIGGKYIQGLDLETQEECQRLCCETENCDAFVFEEKKDGYCYLFQCGPPENIHCKFTKHANYTSSLLTPVRPTIPSTTHKPPVNTYISQQEIQLSNLKQKPKDEKKTTTSTTQAPDIPEKFELPRLLPTSKAIPPNSSSCGRFQFACHSGECIAVYNACDGIPQCEDASDEGPECSGANAKSASNIVATSVDSPTKIVQQPIQSIQNQYKPMINNREDPMSSPSIWSNGNELDRSRIFNHKGGLQIPSNPILQYPSQQQNQAPIYNQGYMQIPQQQPIAQQEVQPIYRSPIITPQDQLIMASNWQQPQQPIQQYVMPAATKVQTLPQVPVQQEPESIPPPSEGDDDIATDLPKKKQRKFKKAEAVENKDDSKAHADNDPVHEQYKMIRDSLEVEFKEHKMEFRDHDGKSDRPEGALLSLSLGLLITAILAIIVTCRMKVVGSRRRTGKVPFGREADFLVNGMYL